MSSFAFSDLTARASDLREGCAVTEDHRCCIGEGGGCESRGEGGVQALMSGASEEKPLHELQK